MGLKLTLLGIVLMVQSVLPGNLQMPLVGFILSAIGIVLMFIGQ